MLEVLAAGKNSTKQDGRVDRRDFGVPHSFTRVNVGEVIKESSMRGQLFPRKPQLSHNSLARLGQWNVSAFLSNAKRGQPKTRGRDACYHSSVIRAHITSVLHQPGLWVGLFPEVEEICSFQFLQQLEICSFQFLQQLVVGLGKICLDRRVRWAGVLLIERHCQERQNSPSEGQANAQTGDLLQQIPAQEIPGTILVFTVHLVNSRRFPASVDWANTSGKAFGQRLKIYPGRVSKQPARAVMKYWTLRRRND